MTSKDELWAAVNIRSHPKEAIIWTNEKPEVVSNTVKKTILYSQIGSQAELSRSGACSEVITLYSPQLPEPDRGKFCRALGMLRAGALVLSGFGLQEKRWLQPPSTSQQPLPFWGKQENTWRSSSRKGHENVVGWTWAWREGRQSISLRDKYFGFFSQYMDH